VLRKLNKYPFAARHYGLFNMPDGKLQVLAMQLLGNSISALRRKQPDSFMPYGSVCHIVLQMLASVEALHQEGYIHRDLKPSNFVHGLGRAGKKQVYVIDFGQSRMFVDEEGEFRYPTCSGLAACHACVPGRCCCCCNTRRCWSPSRWSLRFHCAAGSLPPPPHRSLRPSLDASPPLPPACCHPLRAPLCPRPPPAGNVRPPRPMADFRGTSLYSSLHAHQLKDLGRRDDLWALWCVAWASGLEAALAVKRRWLAGSRRRGTLALLPATWCRHVSLPRLPSSPPTPVSSPPTLPLPLSHPPSLCPSIRRYIFFELARGGLPWKCCKEDRYRCEIAKGYYMAHPEELTAGLPGEAHLLALHAHLRSVPFEGQPDYAFFAECLRGVLADAAAAGKLLQRTWASYKEVRATGRQTDIATD